MSQPLLDVAASDGLFVGRIWNPEVQGPSIVILLEGMLVDITSRETPTLSALLERQDAAAFVRAASGKAVGSLADIAANSTGARIKRALISLRLSTCRQSRPAASPSRSR